MTVDFIHLFDWDGETFRPRNAQLADREFTVGETYRMEVVNERSIASHRQYFAAIRDGWRSFNEDQLERWPTPEHFRKWALIKHGYRTFSDLVAPSKADALRFAAFVRPLDQYAVVLVQGTVVRVAHAASQKYKAMGKKAFQASKEAVLGELEHHLGVAKGTLMQRQKEEAKRWAGNGD